MYKKYLIILPLLSIGVVGLALSKNSANNRAVPARVSKVEVRHVSPLENTTRNYQIMCWSIKKWEKFSLKPYYCEAGVRTVGWGFTKKVGITSVSSIQDADEKFRNLVGEIKAHVDKEYSDIPDYQKPVLVSLLYNSGDYKGLKRSRFVKALRKRDMARAKRELLSWNKVRDQKTKKHRVSQGLVNRRAYEAKILEGLSEGEYQSLKREISMLYIKGKKL